MVVVIAKNWARLILRLTISVSAVLRRLAVLRRSASALARICLTCLSMRTSKSWSLWVSISVIPSSPDEEGATYQASCQDHQQSAGQSLGTGAGLDDLRKRDDFVQGGLQGAAVVFPGMGGLLGVCRGRRCQGGAPFELGRVFGVADCRGFDGGFDGGFGDRGNPGRFGAFPLRLFQLFAEGSYQCFLRRGDGAGGAGVG